MPSKRENHLITKRKNRKEFRKQQRKLKKKSKKLAKQFGKSQREQKLTIKFKIKQSSTHIQNHKNKRNHKKNNKHILRLKYNSNHKNRKIFNKKSVHFADNLIWNKNNNNNINKQTNNIKSILKTSTKYKIENQKQKQKQKQKQNKQDIWIDSREEKWIKSLEKKMGLNSSDNYWKKQEFSLDGLDCFHDLTYFSDESDVDEEQKQKFKQYFDYKQFLETKPNRNGNINSDLSGYRAYKEKQRKEKELKDALKTEKDIQNDINKRNQKKESIYGSSVINNNNDISMKEFLEESDFEDPDSDLDIDNDLNMLPKKYLPPQLRKFQLVDNNSGSKFQLKRCIQGHLNRLLSNNLVIISSEINNYYNDVNNNNREITSILCECIYYMIDKEEETNGLNTIILSLSSLIVSIYHSHQIFIGSNIIEILSNHCYNAILSLNNNNNNNNNKMFLNNLIRLISYLYLFSMISAKYVIEILIEFVSSINDSNISYFKLLQIPMKLCGTQLRTDDAINFKDLIVLICNKSAEFNDNINNSNNFSKNQFDIQKTMKIIYDIKDNKISIKHPNSVNSRQFQQLKLQIRAIQLKSTNINNNNRMPMGFKDFLNIKQYGRWWLPGAPVKGNKNKNKNNKPPQSIWKDSESAYSFSSDLLLIAKQFHMNTPLRRAIFCIVMRSDDYIDAFQKLMSLNINNNQHNEFIRIILLLSIRQNKYNKYYSLLLGKLIKSNRGWKFSLHCALWDKFKEINSMKTNDIINLSSLLSDLINEHYLNLIVLKNLDIMRVSPKNVLFVNNLFTEMLINNNTNSIHNIFATLYGNKKLKDLKQEIELFFNTIMIPRGKNKIIELKKKHKIAQKMVKQNKMSQNELINIGLKLRKQENFVIVLKTALTATHDVQVKTSSYDNLIC